MFREKSLLAGWVIDGTGRKIQKNVLLRVKNALFDKISSKTDDTSIPKGCMDFSQHTLLPGLVDAHVHLCMSGTEDFDLRKRQLNNSFEMALRSMNRHEQQLLAHGVLFVRDGGDRAGHALRYKLERLMHDPAGLSLHASGKAWHKPGRYGSFVGRPVSKGTLSEEILRDDSQIDHVKIIQSGMNSLNVLGKETPFQFSRSELAHAARVCRAKGLKTMVHANGKIPVEIALKAGCHSIEHGFFMGRSNMAFMAKGPAFWVPTACAMKGFAESGKGPDSERHMALKNLDHQLEQISTAKQLGVSVVLGTDSGSIGVHHGNAVVHELKLLMRAGYSLEAALKCATFNGARLLGLEKNGLVREGMKADFIVVKGPPRKLPESLKDIVCIHRDGRFL